MIWTRKETKTWLFEKADGYCIVAANLSEWPHLSTWWEARDSHGREVGSGYRDDGLAKCKRLCEAHARSAGVLVEQVRELLATAKEVL